MVDNLVSSGVTVLTAIIGLAIVATLVSKNANTTGVISAGAGGFSQALSAAEAPVTGSSLSEAAEPLGGSGYYN